MELPENENMDMISALTTKCAICSKLSTSDNKLLTEYVIKICNDTTPLQCIWDEVASFIANLQTRNATDSKYQQQADSEQENTNNIFQHLMFCIAPRDKAVTGVLYRTWVLRGLASAKTDSAKFTYLKLIAQGQAAEKGSSAACRP